MKLLSRNKLHTLEICQALKVIGQFKKRNSLKMKFISGEAGGSIIENAKVTSKDNNLKDIYNMDEAALLYRHLSTKTIASNAKVSGTKRLKDLVTVMLCCNAEGSDVIIGKSKKPRCFKNFRYDLYVEYIYNKNAWVTSQIFEQRLTKFNEDMFRSNRHVVLLLDDASSHKTSELSNVKLLFLSPNTTDALQPLDAGIIRSFKDKYQTIQLKKIMSVYNETKIISIKNSIQLNNTIEIHKRLSTK